MRGVNDFKKAEHGVDEALCVRFFLMETCFAFLQKYPIILKIH